MTLAHQLLASATLFGVLFVELGLGYFPAFYGVAPKLTMTLLYLMLVYDEEPVHLATLVTLGIIYDSLQGNPLGYTSGGLILVAMIGRHARQRLAHPPLSSLWIEFAVAMLVVFAYSVLAMVAYHQRVPAIGYVLFQHAATVLLLPLVLASHQIISAVSGLIRHHI